MKKIFALFILNFITFTAFSQSKVEILYFKAQLPCCQAKACNSLESDIQQIITKNFPKEVTFKQIALAESSNKELVDKYSAKSQTVVLVSTKKKNESSVDVSDIISRYARSNDKDALEKELVAKIKESLK